MERVFGDIKYDICCQHFHVTIDIFKQTASAFLPDKALKGQMRDSNKERTTWEERQQKQN